MQRKTLNASVSKAGPKIEATISTETIDRDGEVLIAQGMDATEFNANPVVFYNHDYAQPIGRVTDLRRSEKKIDATIEFAQRPEGFEEPTSRSSSSRSSIRESSRVFQSASFRRRAASARHRRRTGKTTAKMSGTSSRSGNCWRSPSLRSRRMDLLSSQRYGRVSSIEIR